MFLVVVWEKPYRNITIIKGTRRRRLIAMQLVN